MITIQESFTLTKTNVPKVAVRLRVLLANRTFMSVANHEVFNYRQEIHSNQFLHGANNAPAGSPLNVTISPNDTGLTIHDTQGVLMFSAYVSDVEDDTCGVLELSPEFAFFPEKDKSPERVEITFFNNIRDRKRILLSFIPTGPLVIE